MSQDGSFAVSVGTDRSIRLWDIRDKRMINTIEAASNLSEMNEVCFAKSALHGGNTMATVAHKGGEVSFWDITAMKQVHAVQGYH